jgi:hypothetical protein
MIRRADGLFERKQVKERVSEKMDKVWVRAFEGTIECMNGMMDACTNG